MYAATTLTSNIWYEVELATQCLDADVDDADVDEAWLLELSSRSAREQIESEL